MIRMMRTKFGPVIISVIVGFIAFVFVFWGVFTPDPSLTGGVAGSVNGDHITLSEFSRALDRRMQMFKNLNLSPEQMKNFRIHQSVFNELASRKLKIQDAERRDIIPSDEAVREEIRQIPAFQVDGVFDRVQYKQTLTANNYTPGGFEQAVREDLMVQAWHDRFRQAVKVTGPEIEREFLLDEEKRDIKYVLLTPDKVRKGVKVTAEEVEKYLQDETKENIVKSRYETGKKTRYKDKAYEDVKTEIARDLVASGKTDAVDKKTEELAQEVQKLLAANQASDRKIGSLLKSYEIEVNTTGPVNRMSVRLPGAGDVEALVSDAFAEESSINAKSGGKAKVYETLTGTVVALVIDAQKADLDDLDEARRSQIRNRLAYEKERALSEARLNTLTESAEVVRNESVLQGQG